MHPNISNSKYHLHFHLWFLQRSMSQCWAKCHTKYTGVTKSWAPSPPLKKICSPHPFPPYSKTNWNYVKFARSVLKIKRKLGKVIEHIHRIYRCFINFSTFFFLPLSKAGVEPERLHILRILKDNTHYPPSNLEFCFSTRREGRLLSIRTKAERHLKSFMPRATRNFKIKWLLTSWIDHFFDYLKT